MTDTIESPSAATSPSRNSRGLGWISAVIASGIVLIGGLTTVITTRHLDHQYGPIQGGSFGGQHSARNFVSSKDGFSFSLAATPGITAELISSVDNLGSHSVKITSIGTDPIVTSIRWSAYRIEPGGNAVGIDTPWRSFPAIVPAHGTIRLLITIHHPADCQANPPGTAGRYYDGYHVVKWESLLHRHTTSIDDRLANRNIAVC